MGRLLLAGAIAAATIGAAGAQQPPQRPPQKLSNYASVGPGIWRPSATPPWCARSASPGS